MKKKTITCEPPIEIGGVTIIPVVINSMAFLELNGVVTFSARKEPVYVVLCCRGETKAFDILGRTVPIHQVKSELSHGSDKAKVLAPLQL